MNEQAVAFHVTLDRLTWRSTGGSQWALDASFQVSPQPGGGTAALQAYADETLDTPVGKAVKAGSWSAGSWDQASAGVDLQDGVDYWIAVQAGGQGNPWTSNPLPIMRYGPAFVAIRADRHGVDLLWTPPEYGPVDDYEAGAAAADGSDPVLRRIGSLGYAATDAERSWRLGLGDYPAALGDAPPGVGGVLAVLLSPVALGSDGATSIGPPAEWQVTTRAPRILSTDFLSGQRDSGPLTYRLTVENQGYGTAPDFDAVVYANGVACRQPSLQPSTFDRNGNCVLDVQVPAELPCFPGTNAIPPGTDLAVALAQADAVAIGPRGQRAPLIASSPRIVAARTFDAGIEVELDYPRRDPQPAAAAVAVIEDGAVVALAPVDGTRGTVAFAPKPTAGYTAAVAATIGTSAGPASEPIALATAVPTLTSVAYDGRTVRAQWTAPADAAAPFLRYRLAATSGTQELAATVVEGLSGALDVPAGAGPVLVHVAGLYGGSRGPISDAVDVVAGTTALRSFDIEASDPGTAELSWPAVSGATSYLVQPWLEGVEFGDPLPATGPSLDLDVTRFAGGTAAVAVAAVATRDGATSTGPFGAAVAIPTHAPRIAACRYDGETAFVEWEPFAAAFAFIVSVLDSASHQTVDRTTATGDETSATLAPTLPDLTASYEVVVQAFTTGSGPPSPAVPLFEPSFFTTAASDPPVATEVPALEPVGALADLGTTHAAIAVLLPDIGTLTKLPAEDPFALAAGPGKPFPYELRISAGAWSFPPSQPIRTDIKDASVKFLEAAEDAGVTPLGIAALQQAISRHMPQTFDETLLYAYGLDLAKGSADLRPGMVVRVAFDDYVSVPGGATWLTGYAGGAVAEYDVGGYLDPTGAWLTGLDAFVAELVAGGAMEVTQPPGTPVAQTEAGVADAADLFYPNFRTPFYRLFLPSTLQTPTAPGTTRPSLNFAFAAAPSYKALTLSTNQPTADGRTAYFRGRAVVTLCIRVFVDGVEEVVPIGTTVRNLLERYAAAPPGAAVAVENLRLARTRGAGMLAAAAPYDVDGAWPVRFRGGKLPVYKGGVDGLSLPLLHGDRLTIAGR